RVRARPCLSLRRGSTGSRMMRKGWAPPSAPAGCHMLIALLLSVSVAVAAQDATPQKLFESGKYQEAADAVKAQPDAPPDQTYLRALAHRKLGQNEEAKQAFGVLAGAAEGSVWREIGQSGTALVDGNIDGAQ